MNKKHLFILSGLIAVLLPLTAVAVSLDDPLGGTYSDFGSLIRGIATAVGTILASLGTLMIVVAGYLFMTSGGNPQKLATAKSALLYAIIGMITGLLAGAIALMVQSVLP